VKRLAAYLRPLFSSLLLAMFFSAAEAQQQPHLTHDSQSARRVVLFSFPPTGQQYQLRGGDQIALRVFAHPEFSSDLRLDERGVISLPGAGEVLAAGRTVRELRDEIVTRYRKFEKNPYVYVALMEMRSEPVRVYAGHDATGREEGVTTGQMKLDGIRMTLQASYSVSDEVILRFSPVEGNGIYELTALFNGTERVLLSPATKQSQWVSSIHGWYLALSMKVPLKSLAIITTAKELKMRLRDKEFELKGENLEALRFMVQHVSANFAPSRANEN